MKTMTRCPKNHDEIARLQPQTVMKIMTSLYLPYPVVEGGDHVA
jgi:hypothetical protein